MDDGVPCGARRLVGPWRNQWQNVSHVRCPPPAQEGKKRRLQSYAMDEAKEEG